MPALFPFSFDYPSSGNRFHSNQKPVGALSLAAIGLIGSLQFIPPLVRNYTSNVCE